MGKEKESIMNGLPYKNRKNFIEIMGQPKRKLVKYLYRKVAFRLPVHQNYYYIIGKKII